MTKLEQLLAGAAAHPWYRDVTKTRSLADWPILKKSELYSRLESARSAAEKASSIYYSRSGGTTSGRPLFFPTGVLENHRQRRVLAKYLKADGVLSGATIAVNICPIIRMYRAMEIFTEFGERCGATMLPMAALAPDEDVIEIARQFSADTLIGMPSRLVALARTVRRQGIDLKFDTIFFGGEFLQPGKRRLLAETLGVRRFSAIYGSAELGIVAWQSEVSDVPVYRFPKSILHVEIANPDKEGYGAIVGTNLIRQRFPIVRYDTGDIGRIVAEDEAAVTVELQGRKSDSFQIGDNYHSTSDFAHVFAAFAEYQIQIHYDEARMKDVIKFCLVSDSSVSDQEKRKTTEKIHDILQCHEMMYRTEVVFVDSEALVRGIGTSKTPAVVDTRGR